MSRKIIIPQGVVDDSLQNSIIEIPANLTRSKGNLIAKKQGNKILVQQLPDWQDELSGNNVPETSKIVAVPMGRSQQQEPVPNLYSQSPHSTNQTFYSAKSEEKTNYLTIPDGSISARTCYNTAVGQTPSTSQIKVQGNDLSIETNVESNVQMNDTMIANVLADTRRTLNSSINESYSEFNPLLSSTQKSFELSTMHDPSEESDFFFLGAPLSRSQEGKYNIISPMTPSPTKLASANRTVNKSLNLNKTRKVHTPCARQAGDITVPQSNRTYINPQVSNQTYMKSQETANQTFLRPQRNYNKTFQSNQTYLTPQEISNRTLVAPKGFPDQTFVTQEGISNQTFATPRRIPNETYLTSPTSKSLMNESSCTCSPHISYSDFNPNPITSSTQRSFEMSSVYNSSDESDFFFMGAPVSRSQEGKYNIISPMTPSPTKPAATAGSLNFNKTQVQKIPQPNQTYVNPQPNQTYMKSQNIPNQTFIRPQRKCNKTINSNQTYVTPQDRTFVPPQKISNQTFMTKREAPNQTFVKQRGISNQTFTTPQGISNQTRSLTNKNKCSCSPDISYSDFDPNPITSSTQRSLELSSVYDSEESDFFFMGAPLSRSQEGKYNIISPMTPSPTKLATGNVRESAARSIVDDCACESQNGSPESIVAYESSIIEDVYTE